MVEYVRVQIKVVYFKLYNLEEGKTMENSVLIVKSVSNLAVLNSPKKIISAHLFFNRILSLSLVPILRFKVCSGP